jgi:protein phosphatase
VKLSFPKSQKIYVISDLHGGLEIFKDLINKVSVDSYLFILGDLFEKGLESLKTLQYVMELDKLDNVFVIMGNNDIAFLKTLEPQYLKYFITRITRSTSIIYQMIQANKLVGSPLTLQEQIKSIYCKEIAWLSKLDYRIEIDDFLCVHAGINENEDDLKTIVGIDNFYILGHNSPKIVICGHYPTAMYHENAYNNNVIIDLEKRIICIDGGYGATNLGQLNMLEIKKVNNKYQYTSFESDYYQQRVVKQSYEGKGNLRGICYPNYEIEIISQGPYFSKVRVLNTNEIVYIKNELIIYQDGQYYSIDDCPNNLLAIKKGESVKIIRDDTLGFALVKKKGICGWVSYDYLEGYIL